MSLYTRTGDDGTTGLINGDRVKKDSLRIEACGAVDELNSAIGFVISTCLYDELSSPLKPVQSCLFEIGAKIATPSDNSTDQAQEDPHTETSLSEPTRHAQVLEQQIDAISASLPPLRQFVLPGGSELAARLHLARSICRRAERRCVSLVRDGLIQQQIVVYLNRLSDLLFTMARRANQLESIEDIPWPGHGK